MDKTRVIGADELQQIHKEAKKVYVPETEEEPEEADEDEEEEDEEGILNPKMEKAVTIMGIAAAVIIIAIIVFIVLSFFDVFKFGSGKKTGDDTEIQTETQTDDTQKDTSDDEDMITMIDVKNKTFDEAKSELEAIGLRIEQEGVSSSDTVEEGKIISQSVQEGTSVAKNSTVKVTISSGAGSVEVPDVTNYTSSEAQSRLTEAGFVVTTDYDYSDLAQDHVIRTEPAAHSSARAGDTIKIIIAITRFIM